MKRAKAAALNFVLVALILGAYLWVSQWEKGSHYQSAPTFELPLIENGALAEKTIGLKSFQGKPLLINFWASWCTACESEQGQLTELWNKYGQSSLKMIGIASMDTLGDIVASGKLTHRQYQVALDKDGSVAQSFGAHALPHTFLLNGRGQVVGTYQGVLNQERLQSLESQLQSLFADK